uniref:Uncharacterized protein n=1 Tax=Arundo donax TaxID=35708 RepID=A0A0A9EWI8_ARUDO
MPKEAMDGMGFTDLMLLPLHSWLLRSFSQFAHPPWWLHIPLYVQPDPVQLTKGPFEEVPRRLKIGEARLERQGQPHHLLLSLMQSHLDVSMPILASV